MNQFAYAHSYNSDPEQLVKNCITQLGDLPEGANLGFVYATDSLARDLDTASHSWWRKHPSWWRLRIASNRSRVTNVADEKQVRVSCISR